MKSITAPRESALYSDLAARTVMDVRMKLGMSHIHLNYREMFDCLVPVVVVDFFNEKGRLYTLRYNLPPDTPERTGRRISLLLHLLRKELGHSDDDTAQNAVVSGEPS